MKDHKNAKRQNELDALKRQSEELQTILDASPALIFYKDRENRFIRVNKAMAELTGLSPEEMEDRSLFDIYPPDQAKEFWKDDMEVISSGRPKLHILEVLETRTGNKWFMTDKIPYRDSQGNIVGIIGFSVDITDQKRAEEELSRKSSIDAALSELYKPLTKPGATIPEICKIILKHARELTGSEHGYVSTIDPVTGDNIGHTLTEMMEGMCQVEKEYQNIVFPRGSDGLYRGLWGFTLNTRKPMFTNSPTREPASVGIPAGHIVMNNILSVPVILGKELVGQITLANSEKDYSDEDVRVIKRLAEYFALAMQRKKYEAMITDNEEELRKMNEDLIQRADELEAANRELSAFSYSASHVMRAPLRAINGFSTMLLEEYAGMVDDEGKRMLKVVIDNAATMGQYIEDILEFSNIRQSEVRPSKIKMNEAVKEILEELAVGHRKINIKVDILPDAWGDRVMVRQILRNLIKNAVKFTRNREDAEIEIGWAVPTGQALSDQNIYYVKDNGVGFDMKYVGKLFGVFQRLHSDEEFEGTGMGLAVVKRLAEKQGGHVRAEGKVNEGATFYFSLPKDRGQMTEDR